MNLSRPFLGVVEAAHHGRKCSWNKVLAALALQERLLWMGCWRCGVLVNAAGARVHGSNEVAFFPAVYKSGIVGKGKVGENEEEDEEEHRQQRRVGCCEVVMSQKRASKE